VAGGDGSSRGTNKKFRCYPRVADRTAVERMWSIWRPRWALPYPGLICMVQCWRRALGHVEGRDWEEGASSASDLWSSECLGLGNIGQNNLGFGTQNQNGCEALFPSSSSVQFYLSCLFCPASQVKMLQFSHTRGSSTKYGRIPCTSPPKIFSSSRSPVHRNSDKQHINWSSQYTSEHTQPRVIATEIQKEESYISQLMSNIDPHIPLHILLNKRREWIHLKTHEINTKYLSNSKNNLHPFVRQNATPHDEQPKMSLWWKDWYFSIQSRCYC